MIVGAIILCLGLVHAGCAQEYEVRGSRASFRGYDDEELQPAKPAPTVVPILKQIDRHNDDGSYTYGFEAADGSFKIETKQANGEVRGKYGYTDANGKLHVVEYGANKYGFQPAGEGITVPPINLNAEPEPEYEEELPRRVQNKPQPIQPKRPAPAPRPAPVVQQLQAWEQPENDAPVFQATPAPAPRPRPAQQQPHIIYNNAPTPKRPVFFTGAQSIPDGAAAPPQQSFERAFEQAQAAPRPPRPQPQPQPQPRPQPAPARTLAFEAQAPSRPRAPFVDHSVQFRQNVKFAQPVLPEPPQPQQLFRPEPTRAQFAELAEYDEQPVELPSPPRPRLQQLARPQPVLQQLARPRPAPAARVQSGGGFLDQLEQQFSLPSNTGNPTHNIAFGFY